MKQHVDDHSLMEVKILGFPVNHATQASINGTINGSVVLPLTTMIRVSINNAIRNAGLNITI